MLASNWNYPTTIWFGENKINSIIDALQSLNVKKPLIVTDPALASLDCVKSLQALLQQGHIQAHLFSGIKPNPTASNVRTGINAFELHQCDSVIAIGGGSALDCGKSIAVCAKQSCDIIELEDVGDNFKHANVDAIVPCIAIPTTAGTGSEVGRAALIIDEDSQSKKIIFHPNMTPNIVIADPTLLLTLPAKLTAATGMDALAHNLEAYCAPGFHPMADGIALEGMRLIKENLVHSYKNGDDINARAHMLCASIMGATAFQKGLGAIHSLSHPVGALYDAHHGLLNAIFMPYVLKLNQPVIEDKMQRLADFLELKQDGSGFDRVYQWVLDLMQALDLPTSLSAINIGDSKADIIAKQALKDGSTPSNPFPLTEANLKATFTQAVKGLL